MTLLNKNPPTWNFREQIPGEMLVDPIQEEFFTTDIIGGLSEALIRECIQNSLDAKSTSSEDPVRVRIGFFNEGSALVPNQYSVFFKNIKAHISADGNGLNKKIDFTGPMPFLIIEDFGTQGLEGDPYEDYIDESAEGNHNFAYFWRNYGRSGKHGNSIGRWGLGKTVFPASSKMNTFFGLTVRESDKKAYLMGQSVLKWHKCHDGVYNPYGSYGIENSDANGHLLTIPIEAEIFLNNFSSTFALTRNGNSGLSIVIPHPEDEITGSNIFKAAATELFYPILAGILEIDIEFDSDSCHIRPDNFDEILNSNNFRIPEKKLNNLLDLIKFTKSVLIFDKEQYITVNCPDSFRSPKWEDELFNDINISDIKTRFDSGEILGFSVPLQIRKKDKSIETGGFKVYLQKDPDLTYSESYFIREGFSVKGMSQMRSRNIRGMVVIDDGPLSTMLGDAEGPAHTEWQKDSMKFKEKYYYGSGYLNFVKDSIKAVSNFLSRQTEEINEKILGNIFFVEAPEKITDVNPPEGPDSGRGKGRKITPPTPTPTPHSPPKPYRIDQIKGGAIIKSIPVDTAMPDQLEIRFAYNIRKGNPFKAYNPLDFDISQSPIQVASSGVEIINKSNNILIVRIKDKEFEIKVSGFDENRDLAIRSNSRRGMS
jgi:hypothetical protein